MEHLHMPTGHFFPTKTDVNTKFYHKAVMQDARVRGVIIPTASAQDRHRLLATSIAFEGPSYSLGTAFLGWPPVVMAGPVRLYEGLRRNELHACGARIQRGRNKTLYGAEPRSQLAAIAQGGLPSRPLRGARLGVFPVLPCGAGA